MLKAKFFDGVSSVPKEVTIVFNGPLLTFDYLDIFEFSTHISWGTQEVIHETHTHGTHRKISHHRNELIFLELYDQDFSDLDHWLKEHKVNSKKYALFLNRGLVVTLLVGVLALFPLIYFVALPLLANYGANHMPLQYEQQIGEEMANSILSTVTEDKVKSAYADSFAAGFRTRLDVPIKIYVVESEELNAFALPGGKIFVYSAMLDACKNKEEFAALLGHEIGHVQLRHTTKSILRAIIGKIVFSIILSDFNNVAGAAAEQAERLKDLHYSRNLERDADEYSVSLLHKTGVDPNGIIKLFSVFEKEEEKQGMEIPEFLSSHPLTSERINDAKEHINKLQVRTTQNAKLDYYFNKLKGK